MLVKVVEKHEGGGDEKRRPTDSVVVSVGGINEEKPPTSGEDSLVVVQGGVDERRSPTSHQDSLMVVEGDINEKRPPTSRSDSLVWVWVAKKGHQRVVKTRWWWWRLASAKEGHQRVVKTRWWWWRVVSTKKKTTNDSESFRLVGVSVGGMDEERPPTSLNDSLVVVRDPGWRGRKKTTNKSSRLVGGSGGWHL